MVIYVLAVYGKEYKQYCIFRGSKKENRYWNEKLKKRELVMNDWFDWGEDI